MKTNSNWLLKTIRIVLGIIWYVNIVLIFVAFTMLTFKFISNDYVEFSTPVKYAASAQITKMESLTPNATSITVQRDQDILKLQLKNTAGNIVVAYFFFVTLEILVMIIIYQLRKFFDTLKQNAPFRYDNIRRLKITALCFALLTVLHILLGVSTALILKHQVKDFSLLNMVWTESFIGLMLGAVIYVMADVFNYGFTLQKENGEFV